MSIQRDGSTCQLVCDSCGTESDTSDDFHALIDEVKADGWSVVQRDGAWRHYCTTCEPNGQHESALDRAKRMFSKR